MSFLGIIILYMDLENMIDAPKVCENPLKQMNSRQGNLGETRRSHEQRRRP